MSRLSLLLLLFALATVHAYSKDRKTIKEKIEKAFQLWSQYKEDYGKEYEEVDEIDHMEAFIKNTIIVDQHNKEASLGRKSFFMEINHLADLTFAQYQKLNGFSRSFMDRKPTNASRFLVPYNFAVPDAVDWRDKNLVSSVKNQGHCGSCWAFSAVGALEGQHSRATGELVELSEQNLIDCSSSFGNDGCDGGLMDPAFEYVKQNGGIDTEKSYPYHAKDEECHFSKADVGAEDQGYVHLPYTEHPQIDEETLRVAVATVGPISVAIDAGSDSFQLYKSGVYYNPQCTTYELGHAVLVVGYGTDPKYDDYWLVKNSWGMKWGEQGYIRMARNKKNHCGIASQASYPLV